MFQLPLSKITLDPCVNEGFVKSIPKDVFQQFLFLSDSASPHSPPLSPSLSLSLPQSLSLSPSLPTTPLSLPQFTPLPSFTSPSIYLPLSLPHLFISLSCTHLFISLPHFLTLSPSLHSSLPLSLSLSHSPFLFHTHTNHFWECQQ